ncbi:hypothetical protein OG589_34485 [Sphaerisporangium sp. NBC_01403]|uniref:hypothetical protein n=1 Tax=Sphaerisporangium sp. NBC_01403 TaxID=2903599 RepID=UPI003247FFE6
MTSGRHLIRRNSKAYDHGRPRRGTRVVVTRGGPPGERRIGTIVDPDVPWDVANMLRGNERLLSRIRAGWTPEHQADFGGPRIPRRIRVVSAGLASFATVLMLFSRLIGTAVFVLLMGGVLVAYLLMGGGSNAQEEDEIPERIVYGHARRYQGRFLLPEDFDAASRELLARSRTAVDSVLRSRVNQEGLMDDLGNAVILPAHEWEIARLLAKLSALRSEHAEIVGTDVSHEVSAVVSPLERVLAASEAAVTARVEALERYSRHIAQAERAYHARNQIEALRERLPRYEELLAEAGSDRLAVPEIAILAEDADRLEQALKDSVKSAHEAFRYLDDPGYEDSSAS